MTDSYVKHHADGGTTFVGPDATNFVRAVTLRAALRMYAETKMRLARNITPTQMLTMAGEYTGKVYLRGDYTLAAEELSVWIETMRAALPHTTDADTPT